LPFLGTAGILLIIFYAVNDFGENMLFRRVLVTSLALIVFHGLLIYFLWLVSRYASHRSWIRVLAYSIYIVGCYFLYILLIASTITYYHWSAPINDPVLRDFLFHWKTYSALAIPVNPNMIGAVLVSTSLLTIGILIYRKRAVWEASGELFGKFRWKTAYNWLLIMGAFSIILSGMHEPTRSWLLKTKDQYVWDDPILSFFYSSLRRGYFKRQVRKSEIQMDKHLGDKPEYIANRNLILITVDGLRPDFLYGSNKSDDLTPFIDSLLRTTPHLMYTNAYANCNYSVCGLLTILSGEVADDAKGNFLSLQHYLHHVGYSNYFILSGNHAGWGLDIKYGSKLDSYFEGPFSRMYVPTDDRIILEGLSHTVVNKSDPSFFWFHLMSTHCQGVIQEQYQKYHPTNFNLFADVDSQNILGYVNNYKNGIIQADALIAEILATVIGPDDLENYVIVITADHGENLGEYGELVHGKHLRREELSIPLLVIDPLIQSDTSDELVCQRDFASLMLAQLKIAEPNVWLRHKAARVEEGIPVVSATRKEHGTIHQDTNGIYLMVSTGGSKAYRIRMDETEMGNNLPIN